MGGAFLGKPELGKRAEGLTEAAGAGIPWIDKTQSRRELAMASCPQFLSVRESMDCSHLPPSARTRWLTERIASSGGCPRRSDSNNENAGSNQCPHGGQELRQKPVSKKIGQ